MINLRAYIVGSLLLYTTHTVCQPMPVTDQSVSARLSFVSTAFNRIQGNIGLDSFYHKLYQLKTSGHGRVNIVHIGDSHIQADFLSGVLRKNLQAFAGNAGRGLVFPYQLAQSNAPSDILSSSTVRWDYNRIAKPPSPVSCGISGFGLRTTTGEAVINITLRQADGIQLFNKIRLFTDADSTVQWFTGDDELPVAVSTDTTVMFPVTASSVRLLKKGGPAGFHGISLELDTSGIVYHTIGVNGARYDQYNDADLFWEQLPALNADLYIVSLGTNEAQAAAFSPSAFITEVETMIRKLKMVSPHAAILITSAPDSYKARRSNAVLRQLNETLRKYCTDQSIPLWDLYRISNGFGSAYNWSRRGLMSRDRVHFTAEGYRLQGTLLYSALAKGYNDYIRVFATDQKGRSSSLLVKDVP